MSNIVPILQMLNLPITAGVAEILDALRTIQRRSSDFQRSAENWARAYEAERSARRQAENPENWTVQFTGDEDYIDPATSPLVHGNLVTIEGSGQILFHYTPRNGA